ncbi:MAG: HAMP domain-containing sensor histidine kinase [Bacteroidia bacterium]
MQEIDELKNRFFTHISHEFRTPLTVILGMAEQMEQNPGRWQEKGLGMIRQNGRQLLDLINQLLDLRKLEAGQLKPRYILGDVVPYFQYLSASFESLAEIKDLRIHFESDVDATEWIMI